jgi:hypothetical protein
MKLGEKWNSDPRFKTWFHSFDLVIGIVIVLTVVAFVWHKIRSARGPAAGASP